MVTIWQYDTLITISVQYKIYELLKTRWTQRVLPRHFLLMSLNFCSANNRQRSASLALTRPGISFMVSRGHLSCISKIYVHSQTNKWLNRQSTLFSHKNKYFPQLNLHLCVPSLSHQICRKRTYCSPRPIGMP
jgi:hypothetical protein